MYKDIESIILKDFSTSEKHIISKLNEKIITLANLKIELSSKEQKKLQCFEDSPLVRYETRLTGLVNGFDYILNIVGMLNTKKDTYNYRFIIYQGDILEDFYGCELIVDRRTAYRQRSNKFTNFEAPYINWPLLASFKTSLDAEISLLQKKAEDKRSYENDKKEHIGNAVYEYFKDWMAIL
jgi:hypothetical protein